MASRHTMDYLHELQAYPLNIKISLTKSRIREWINHYGTDGVYISFSGGKDSTVLLDIARSMYPDIRAVFVDTGLEYPEIRDFVFQHDNVTILKPKKNLRQVICDYGYPLFSKEVSECVVGARKYLTSILQEQNALKDRQTPYSANFADLIGVYRRQEKDNEDYKAIKMGIIPILPNDAPVMAKMFFGQYMHKEKGVETNEVSLRYDKSRYKFMLDAPFEISSVCCNEMKKKPMHRFQRESHMNPITAQMASESRLRMQKWLQNGCNAFDIKNPISNPMSFWSEQDVLLYIYERNLPIASVYGDIVIDYAGQGQVENQMSLSDFGVFDDERPLLKTTGCSRTGCFACGYGMHLEKPCECRIQKTIDFSNPMLADWQLRGGHFRKSDGMWEPKGGLGMWFVLEWVMSHSSIRYYIPNRQHYIDTYSTDETRKYLEKG